jgi:hypothetical protein
MPSTLTPIPISALPPATTPLVGDELIAVVQEGVTKKTEVGRLPNGGGGGGGGSGLPVSITTWTTAQLMTLNAPGNSLTLVPAPGVGKIAVPVAILMQGIPGAVPFTTVGDWAISYEGDDPVFPLVANPPSYDIMTSLTARVDYAPLTAMTYGLGFESISGSTTWATVGAVSNKPIVLWSPNGGWDSSGGVDQGLMVTVYYVAQDAAVPVTPPPSNDAYAESSGAVEVWNEKYENPVGFDLAVSFNSFRSLGLSWDTYVYKQSGVNPWAVFPAAGLYQAIFPCIVEISLRMIGVTIQTPFSASATITNTMEIDDQYGASVGFSNNLGLLTGHPPFTLSATTGPIPFIKGAAWDGNINIEACGLLGSVCTIQKLALKTTVIAVLGRFIAGTVDVAGTGYAVGDYIALNEGYIRAILKVLTITGGTGVATFSIIDPGKGFAVETPSNTTTAITGGGSGCRIFVTSASTDS